MKPPRLLIVPLALALAACGSRGDPRPPLRLLPPPTPQLSVAQVATDAVLQFDPIAAQVMSPDGVPVDVDRVELLVMTQRYPVVSADVLALLLDRERRERLEQAREATEAAAAASLQRQREEELREAIAAAEAAGEEPPMAEPAPVPEEEPEPEEALTEEEIALRRLPSTVRQAWRDGNASPGTLLEAAQRLEQAVDDLWDALGMPTAIVDVEHPPELPDPVTVIATAERVARSRTYEIDIDAALFEEGAEVGASIPIDRIGDYTHGGKVQIAYPLGAPSVGALHQRYFFALRTVSTRNRNNDIAQIVALAPIAVPLPPTALQAKTLAAGVLLTWKAPGEDLLGNALQPDQLEYNVYRRDPSAAVDAQRVTPVPVREMLFLDTSMKWNERHVYEVRALLRPVSLEAPDDQDAAEPAVVANAVVAPTAIAGSPIEAVAAVPSGPRKESAGATTEPLRVEDIFPPPAVPGLTAVRAANRVTLRWTDVEVPDLRGYRVYRHAVPAPDLPGPVPGLVYPDVPTALQTNAVPEAAGATETPHAGKEEPAARRQLRNRMIAAGWEMLTPVAISESRFIDPLSDPTTAWIYVVEAVDESRNVSLPASATLPAREQP